MQIRKALSPDREAHVAMILEEHAALIRQADRKRDERMAPLLAALEIPEGILVNREPRDVSGVAHLVYDGPDIAPPDGIKILETWGDPPMAEPAEA